MERLIDISIKPGSDRSIKSLVRKAPGIIEVLKTKLDALMLLLAGKIVSSKLSGQMLARRTGILAGSVHPVAAEVTGDVISGGVAAGEGPAFYGSILEAGSKPHVIYSSKARALKFISSGQERFARYVFHPGTRPRPYMASAFAENAQEIRDELNTAFNAGMQSEE